MFRCAINEGEKDERWLAAGTREELDRLVAKLERRGDITIRTKRFFRTKSKGETE